MKVRDCDSGILFELWRVLLLDALRDDDGLKSGHLVYEPES
jgi:hypothetical protein